MTSEVRYRTQAANVRLASSRDPDDSTDEEDEPVDPYILSLYSEPLGGDGEQPPPLPYSRRTLWSPAQVYSMLLALSGVVIVITLYISAREMKQLEEKAALQGVKNMKQSNPSWWTTALIYRVDVRSFYDSNDDGVGDLQGILEKLPYLNHLRVDAILLSPLHASAMLDHGRDITDFMAVDHRYGSIKDLNLLVDKIHELGMKVIMELVPNHTSNLHLWFTESRKGGKDNKYKDYYMWHRGRVMEDGRVEPPNNWRSRYGNSSWTWDERRSAFYLHQYLPQMPDLNHRHPAVRKEFQDIVQFWLEQGIDGIHFEGIGALFEVEDLTLDEPEVHEEDAKEKKLIKSDYDLLSHVYTNDQPEIHEYMATWRELIEHFHTEEHKKISLSIEIDDVDRESLLHYYLTGVDYPISYTLADTSTTSHDCDASCVQDEIDMMINALPDTKSVLWALSGEWRGRIASRIGVEYAAVRAMLQLLLPGAALVYYGDELGMIQPSIQHSLKHPQSSVLHARDSTRTPMQWSGAVNAGFSRAAHTWLPAAPDFKEKNVHDLQASQHQEHASILKLYHQLATLRREPAFMFGNLQYALVTDSILSFMRFAVDEVPYLVCVNLGHNVTTHDYTLAVGMEYGEIIAHTHPPKYADTFTHTKVDLTNLKLRPAEGVVVKLF